MIFKTFSRSTEYKELHFNVLLEETNTTMINDTDLDRWIRLPKFLMYSLPSLFTFDDTGMVQWEEKVYDLKRMYGFRIQ